jgi:flagellar basal-body rod protein FlgB
VALFDVTQMALEKALSGAAMRQRVLADNLANVNTAGFKRSEVDFQSALATALDGETEPAALETLNFTPQVEGGTSVRADGNDVDVDAEMASLSENAVTYQAIVAVAKERMGMLQIALGTRTA